MTSGKVFFDVMASLDGYIAPEGMDMAHADDPEYKQWMNKWSQLTGWVFQQQFFQKNLKLGDKGETGRENQWLMDTFNRTGASIMGKRMFEGGERFWPEDAPFHTPVYVLTHQVRKPWERPGGTTFYFVNDGIESALRQARQAAGSREIRIAGGANVIQQFLKAGLVDEFSIHYTPVFFEQGTPLFLTIASNTKARIKDTFGTKNATHVTYELEK